MELTPEEQETLETYNKNAETWSYGHQISAFWKDERETFNRYLPTGKILDVGCGSGNKDVPYFIEKGYDYTGIDFSEEMIRLAKINNPDTEFVCASVYDMDFPDQPLFDGFYACASLLHLPKTRIHEALQSIKKWMKDGAIGFISLKEGSDEEMKDDLEDKILTRRLFAYYQKEEFEKILKDNGFEMIEFKRKPTPGKTIWLDFFVKVVK